MQEIQKIYSVVDKKNETPETVTLYLTLCEGGVLAYNPGQFITVFFPEFNTPEGKAYSISSGPHEEYLAITVKNMGQFSGKLCSLQIGDTLEGSSPYGFFGPEYDTSRLIIIAGGIGITPLRSILLSSLQKNPQREIYIFYSSKNIENFVFYKEIGKIASQHENTHINSYVTQEQMIDNFLKSRRIEIDDILPYISSNTEILICGSISFTRHFWKSLKDAGVDENTIYTEAFFK